MAAFQLTAAFNLQTKFYPGTWQPESRFACEAYEKEQAMFVGKGFTDRYLTEDEKREIRGDGMKV